MCDIFVDSNIKQCYHYLESEVLNLNTRIKQLRKALGMTQQKFADSIGVKQNTVAQYEIGRNEPIESVIALICKEFNVNRSWLVEGVGDMFTNLPETIMDELAIQYELSDEEKEMVSSFCKLSKEQRDIVMAFLRGKK